MIKTDLNIKSIILCFFSVFVIWSIYTVLITVLVPDISLRSKLFMAVAFSIPSVITLGVTFCKKHA
ncbi:MAG: hypothetical protein IJ389_00625 [Clostridia bacterium]|nr:hypothetical protein [Clostridia bacterium]